LNCGTIIGRRAENDMRNAAMIESYGGRPTRPTLGLRHASNTTVAGRTQTVIPVIGRALVLLSVLATCACAQSGVQTGRWRTTGLAARAQSTTERRAASFFSGFPGSEGVTTFRYDKQFFAANRWFANAEARPNADLWRQALSRIRLEGAGPGNFQQARTEKQAQKASPKHIFWVIPAYKVDYAGHFQPLTPKGKFQEWAQSEYDPLGLAVGVVEAGTIEYSHTDGFCGYGVGLGPFGECYGSLELDATDSSFIGDFVLPVLWHQDPRYFRLGEGSFGRRVWYAVARVFVTYNDSGHAVFYSSALTGTAVAAALSNFYYPPQDVGAGHTMSRIGIDLGNTALYNLAAEFWPDIDARVDQVKEKVIHVF
jgi:hypothetical protein